MSCPTLSLEIYACINFSWLRELAAHPRMLSFRNSSVVEEEAVDSTWPAPQTSHKYVTLGWARLLTHIPTSDANSSLINRNL